jgi:hypothetical protein
MTRGTLVASFSANCTRHGYGSKLCTIFGVM